jgi:hypothetical protein
MPLPCFMCIGHCKRLFSFTWLSLLPRGQSLLSDTKVDRKCLVAPLGNSRQVHVLLPKIHGLSASTYSSWSEYPDTNHHLQQVWVNRTCGG